MINEQIKSEIARQVDDQFKDLKKSFEIFNLPMISQYKVLLWSGLSNGAFLEPNFPLADIQGKIIVIKSFKMVPYAGTAVYVDLNLSDGTTENIPQFARIDRLFDDYRNGYRIQMLINGVQISMFGWVASAGGWTVGYPADFFIDNVFYKYPHKVENLTLQITGNVFENIVTDALDPSFLKVMIECYLI